MKSLKKLIHDLKSPLVFYIKVVIAIHKLNLKFKNRKKMNFFASPDDNLSFLDQVETEIDDPDGKDAEEDNSSGTGESRAESKSVPLSIKPPNPNNNDDADDFQNLIF